MIGWLWQVVEPESLPDLVALLEEIPRRGPELQRLAKQEDCGTVLAHVLEAVAESPLLCQRGMGAKRRDLVAVVEAALRP